MKIELIDWICEDDGVIDYGTRLIINNEIVTHYFGYNREEDFWKSLLKVLNIGEAIDFSIESESY